VRKNVNKYIVGLPEVPERKDLYEKLDSCFESGWWSNFGPIVTEFENELSSFFSVDPSHITTVANATLGLQLVLTALNLKKGKVILPSFTFLATACSVVQAGLTPVFVDIDSSLCLDPSLVLKCLENDSDIVAVIPVDVYGRSAHVDVFEEMRGRVKVIYDCAHSFGGISDPRGDARIYSFHATKIMGAGEGGAVVSHDPELISRVRSCSNFGLGTKFVGTNAKMSELNATLGVLNLRRFPEIRRKRKNVVQWYQDEFEELDGVQILLEDLSKVNGSYVPILFRSESELIKVIRTAEENGIQVKRYFHPLVSSMPAFERFSVFGTLSMSESISSKVGCFPIHSSYSREDICFISGVVKRSIL
tara:strand:- start:1368 stop:2453 length:1086 start_codon:yes stop_codon:yes gene_type:complete